MDIREAEEYIWNRPKISRTVGLERMRCMMRCFGNPHKAMKIIHVAGTNGKGSVSTYLGSVLQQAGYRTGVYTSPHLEKVNERISLNGADISDEELVRYAEQIQKTEKLVEQETGEGLSEFEVLTSVAFLYYAQKKADFVILEVGLGGRFDATNICVPLISVITSIGFDHETILGNTVQKIAYEKSGIIKSGVPLVVGVQKRQEAKEVLFLQAKEKQSPIYFVQSECIKITEMEWDSMTADIETPLGKRYPKTESTMSGIYQAENMALALSAIDCLVGQRHISVTEEQIRKGIRDAKISARMEIVSNSPLILVDGAHNSFGLQMLYRTLSYFLQKKKIEGFVFVTGMMRDKNIDAEILALKELSEKVIFVELKGSRALTKKEFIEKFSSDKYMDEKKYDTVDIVEQEDMQVFCGNEENCCIFDKKEGAFSQQSFQKQAKKVPVFGEDIVYASTIEQAVKTAMEHIRNKNYAIVFAGSLYLAGEVKMLFSLSKEGRFV